MAVEGSAQPGHWNQYAARWQLVGAPLRPSPTDIAYLVDSVERLSPPAPAPQGLLLGVTPEIGAANWKRPLRLVAVDRSEGMVKAVWPGNTATRRALVGDWLSLQLPEAPFDVVLGDGVFSLLAYPAGYAALAAALAAVTKPSGLLSLRMFCRLAESESVDDVIAALDAGAIGNFHIFKWRLAMALQGNATHGVRLADIWDTFEARTGGADAVAQRTGWPAPVVRNIDSYRGVQDRYSFSTEREVADCLAPDFELIETWRPSYELGERCPHLSFRRRA